MRESEKMLTPRQKEMIKIAKRNGKLTLHDSMMYYSDERARKNAIKRLIVLGFIKPTQSVGVFDYIGDEKSLGRFV